MLNHRGAEGTENFLQINLYIPKIYLIYTVDEPCRTSIHFM